MIIKTISHNKNDTKKQRKGDLHQQSYTKNEKYHPFTKEREFVRALNATKIERLLAKPFIKSFSDHREGILRIAKHPENDIFISSSFDNSVNVYNISDLESSFLQNSLKLDSIANGISFFNDNLLISQNEKVNLYDINFNFLKVFKAGGYVNFVSAKSDILICSTMGCEIFDAEKVTAKHKYGNDNFTFGTFDQTGNVIGCSANNEIVLIDNRADKEFSRFEIGTKTNYMAFKSNFFVSANDDNNAYLHDLRYLQKPIKVFHQHVNAVMCVDYHPFKNEIVTGSFDKTLRIFATNEKKSRDIYYNKRMHNVNSVLYSTDGKFILSGSDDGNLRVWKSEASKKINMNWREKENMEYLDALKDKYKDVKEIKRISKHRFLPKGLKGQMKNDYEHYKAVERKNNKNK